MRNMTNYEKIIKNNKFYYYGLDSDFSSHSVHNIIIYDTSIFSYYFQFHFRYLCVIVCAYMRACVCVILRNMSYDIVLSILIFPQIL